MLHDCFPPHTMAWGTMCTETATLKRKKNVLAIFNKLFFQKINSAKAIRAGINTEFAYFSKYLTERDFYVLQTLSGKL